MTVRMLFTVVFLSIFLLTAVATVFGAAKIRPFHKMPDKWIKILIGPLLIELGVAVIGVFITLYEVRVERYTFLIHYSNFLPNWKSSITDADRNCLKDYITTKSKTKLSADRTNLLSDLLQPCREIAEAYERKSFANQKKGKGRLFLNRGANSYDGIVIYRFPNEETPTVLEVTGQDGEDGSINLSFAQQEGLFRLEGGVIIVRPFTTFGPIRFLKKIEGESTRYEASLIGSDGVTYGIIQFFRE